ncbi:alkaline phosphatase family protein [Granulicella sp. WH15]|uniref:phospholipase C n=1 Tax=Granulicella sp. WH15 TaxID=2602070 RepID=UPI0013669EF9|nr:alkaline phosphatase family protein [Granulicella sp. WH15]QHN04530.1 alkaline phosphatase family protein [Granulicella sp. WH15]
MIRKFLALSLSTTIVLTGCSTGTSQPASTAPAPVAAVPVTSSQVIKHVVVIFGENISFDHYFGTYPNAANLPGETPFTAATGTPTKTTNYISTPSLLTANPNLNKANNVQADPANGYISVASNPFRLAPAQAGTGDQDHNYGPEQTAFDNGKMDLFPLSVGTSDQSVSANFGTSTNAPAIANTNALTMGYYDGNTVTAMWNYAQHYALNDHSFGTTFGASTQGAINLVSGQTNGVATYTTGAASGVVADGQGGYTLVGDEDPAGDTCSSASANVSMSGKNIGDLLNAAGVSWGFFEGGFNLGVTNANGTTGCGRSTAAVNIPGNLLKADYIPHHEPFQYYPSTANPTHIRPASVAVIGTAADTGAKTANHQYDIQDFDAALAAGNLPAVSFLKAPGFQDGHASYSDPLDEQTFVVNEVNAIEKSPFWTSTAIILAYDDSDGWYDHISNVINGSQTSFDSYTSAGICGSASLVASALPGPNSAGKPVQGRCGFGPRLPLLVISPWSNKNYIDSNTTDQSSITRFIEDTFLGGKRIGGGSFDASAGSLDSMFNFSNNVAPNPSVVLLNPTTGAVTSGN